MAITKKRYNLRGANMKVTIYSRDDMEKLLLSGKIEKTAIISFHDPIGRGRRCVEDYTPPVDRKSVV